MKENIKVLQVFGSLNMGGAESRMMDIYRHLDRQKCQFDFLTMADEKQFFENEILSLGGKIIKIESPRSCGIVKHFLQLRQYMRIGKYNAVHAHTSYHCGLVMAAAWMEHIPGRISHARTTGTKQSGKIQAIFRRIGSVLINAFSTHRLAISKAAGEFLFGNHDFEVVPNAIDLEKYYQVKKSVLDSLAKEIGIKDQTFVIGQIGRFDLMKNQEFTVHWFSQYIKENAEAVLIFVGDGVLRVQIEEKVRELGLEDHVIFTGVRSDVNCLLHLFNVVLFPSLFEGLGGVALESQAVGVPCVESDTIPEETDLGLGLIKRCSLDSGYEVWNEAVDSCKKITIPSCDIISAAFDKKGYSLSRVMKRYLEIYGGK